MADGGASTIIMLVTALLISSAASAVLIQEWAATSRAIQQQQEGLQVSEQISIDFAGDPMMVELSTATNPNEIHFYLLNSGSHTLKHSNAGGDVYLTVFVQGVLLDETSIDADFVPLFNEDTNTFQTPTQWEPNVMMEISLSHTSFNDFSDQDNIKLYVTARSNEVSGLSMSTSMSEEVRLHEV
ncbi:MAG: hypothetical protein CMA63_00535 [Euryarchaeota archaeon]|nr:hypothetical protein [Euryarchaeota archaeon]|tara:strand:- start:10611 stop:11162 length:552 start_codon:yes stop_codon:yes gene_type:complete